MTSDELLQQAARVESAQAKARDAHRAAGRELAALILSGATPTTIKGAIGTLDVWRQAHEACARVVADLVAEADAATTREAVRPPTAALDLFQLRESNELTPHLAAGHR